MFESFNQPLVNIPSFKIIIKSVSRQYVSNNPFSSQTAMPKLTDSDYTDCVIIIFF